MQYHRLTTGTHIDNMVNLGGIMHRESDYRDLDFSRDKLVALGQRIMASENMFAEGVYRNDVFVGMMIGQISEYWFGRDLIAKDTVWYVHPDHRGSPAGLRLLQHFSEWAIEKGAREICIGLSSGINPERVGKFLERLKFESVGGLYKRRIF